MKTIYNVGFDDDELYEAEAMFDEKGKLIGAWFQNDADWRGEYFDGFLMELGITVEYRDATPEETEIVREHFGF